MDMLKALEALEGKTPHELRREYEALRQLHTQVVLQYRQAKTRGDAQEAEQLREWIGDLVA